MKRQVLMSYTYSVMLLLVILCVSVHAMDVDESITQADASMLNELRIEIQQHRQNIADIVRQLQSIVEQLTEEALHGQPPCDSPTRQIEQAEQDGELSCPGCLQELLDRGTHDLTDDERTSLLLRVDAKVSDSLHDLCIMKQIKYHQQAIFNILEQEKAKARHAFNILCSQKLCVVQEVYFQQQKDLTFKQMGEWSSIERNAKKRDALLKTEDRNKLFYDHYQEWYTLLSDQHKEWLRYKEDDSRIKIWLAPRDHK